MRIKSDLQFEGEKLEHRFNHQRTVEKSLFDGRPANKLPPKQRLFLKEWAIDKNASKAYVRAFKYKGKNANKLGPALLVKLGKIGQVEKEIEKQEKDLGITAEYILGSLKVNADNCLKVVGGQPIDAAAANTALIALGKNKKLFTEKLELSTTLEDLISRANRENSPD